MDAGDAVREAVKRAAANSRLPCREALELAKRLGVSPSEVGKAADALGVKITGCQLGCFKREI
ncbi:MAG: hypothetical protein HPY55_02360 [Firmicutes bacterium]|nr:hypothetical protein [Bacillota bacterium]